MPDLHHGTPPARPFALYTVVQIALFMTVSGLSWWAFNNFEVYASEGFDPLRYEYYARFGLPNYLLDATSYRIVDILEFIYRYLPPYGGYIFMIALIAIALRFADGTVYISAAIFSPISFYYLSQTGKDGIAILSFIAAAIIAIEYRKISTDIVCLLIIALAIYVRPPVLMYLPLIVLQARYGTRAALAILPLLIFVFNYSIDIYDATSGLDTVADDMGAGAMAQFMRNYSFGYTLIPILTKSLLFFISPAIQPIVGLLKFATSGSGFVLLEAASYGVLLFQIIRNKIIFRFAYASLPYCIILGSTSPFYHFRYLAIVYPFIYVYALYSQKPRKTNATHDEGVPIGIGIAPSPR